MTVSPNAAWVGNLLQEIVRLEPLVDDALAEIRRLRERNVYLQQCVDDNFRECAVLREKNHLACQRIERLIQRLHEQAASDMNPQND